MRWIAFAILAVIMLTAQSALSHRAELFGARPDWLLVLVVFVALHARPHDAVAGAWLLGMAADLMTLERCGLIAMSYVLATVAVVAVRELLFRTRAVTQLVVTVIVALAVHGTWLVYRRTVYPPTMSLFNDFVIRVVLVSVYTAVWAPPLHACLLRLRKTLGFIAPRFGYAA